MRHKQCTEDTSCLVPVLEPEPKIGSPELVPEPESKPEPEPKPKQEP